MAGIAPKGTPDYQQGVKDVLRQIGLNPVGKVIVAAIDNTRKDLTVVPLSEWSGKGEKHCRGLALPEDPLTSAPKGIASKGVGIREKWYAGKRDDQDGVTDDNDERYDPYGKDKVAQGGGSNAVVYFTPGEWGKSGCFAGKPGTLPDEVLVHELVHALRIMQGVFNPVPTVNTNYTNEEEFLAIVIGNVYLSANKKTALVATHWSYDRLWEPLNTSKGFVDDRENAKLLQHYFFQWRPVFRELVQLKGPKFNPFREWFGRL